MKVASLFTGCGGLDLGLHQAGHEIILQCECDPGAQQVLRKAFPGVLLVPDICGLDRLPKETELVAAGFPCIDVSRAGLRQGLEGPSTGLVKHVFRLLAKARDEQRAVPWVLLENVEALLDRAHGGPPPVSWVVQQLEQLGYSSWAHRIICSAGEAARQAVRVCGGPRQLSCRAVRKVHWFGTHCLQQHPADRKEARRSQPVRGLGRQFAGFYAPNTHPASWGFDPDTVSPPTHSRQSQSVQHTPMLGRARCAPVLLCCAVLCVPGGRFWCAQPPAPNLHRCFHAWGCSGRAAGTGPAPLHGCLCAVCWW